MKIHSICLVKDEADIVGDVISEARIWSDYIYIYDNGSTDGTTEILKNIAATYNNVIFYKWSDRPFEDTIRSEVFQAFKHNAQKGDWWCRLDADEFYIDDPRSFLNKIDDGFNTVSQSSYNYYFTDKDLEKYKANPDAFSYKDLKYYKNNWSEIRFVKDNGHLYWPSSASWPVINMKVYPTKIRLKHYQYRVPHQIKKRIQNRKKAYAESGKFGHDQKNIGYLNDTDLIDKKNRIVSHKILDYDDGEETLIANKHIPEWKPDNNFISKFKIFIKNVLYRSNILQFIYKAIGKQQ